MAGFDQTTVRASDSLSACFLGYTQCLVVRSHHAARGFRYSPLIDSFSSLAAAMSRTQLSFSACDDYLNRQFKESPWDLFPQPLHGVSPSLGEKGMYLDQ